MIRKMYLYVAIFYTLVWLMAVVLYINQTKSFISFPYHVVDYPDYFLSTFFIPISILMCIPVVIITYKFAFEPSNHDLFFKLRFSLLTFIFLRFIAVVVLIFLMIFFVLTDCTERGIMTNLLNNQDSETIKTWDDIQTKFECCGVDHFKNWFFTSRWVDYDYVPESCCDKTIFQNETSRKGCGEQITNHLHWYNRGCLKPFLNQHHKRKLIYGSYIIFMLLAEMGMYLVFRHNGPEHVQFENEVDAENDVNVEDVEDEDEEEIEFVPPSDSSSSTDSEPPNQPDEPVVFLSPNKDRPDGEINIGANHPGDINV